FGIGDVQRTTEILDVERRERRRNRRVYKTTRNCRCLESAIEYVDVFVSKVGRVNPVTSGVRTDRQAGPNVTRHADDILRRRAARTIPCGYVSRDGIENEISNRRDATARWCNLEVDRRIRHHASRQSAWYVHGRR